MLLAIIVAIVVSWALECETETKPTPGTKKEKGGGGGGETLSPRHVKPKTMSYGKDFKTHH